MASIQGKFTVDVFDCTVHIRLVDSIKRSANYYFRQGGDEEGLTFEPSGYFCNPFHKENRIGRYFVFFLHEDLSVDVYNHEKSHLVDQILIDRDIPANDEVRAYLDGYISKMFHKFFKDKKVKLKDKR